MPQKLALAPRARRRHQVDDKTALRVGYARYLSPYEMILSQAPSGIRNRQFPGAAVLRREVLSEYGWAAAGRSAADLLQSVPASNPLIAPIGKSRRDATWAAEALPLLRYPQDTKKAHNDRFNVNFQRQLPGQVVGFVHLFFNFGNQHYTYALNNSDPRIDVAQQNALNATVDNPFYNYLTPALFPGPLRNQKTVSLASLLMQYPQYGGLFEVGTLGARERYHSLEFKAQKAFSKGWNFLAAYVYIHEKTQTTGFNEHDTYQNHLHWQNSNQPRHRFTMAGTYELPFGKGRPVCCPTCRKLPTPSSADGS